MLFYGSRKFKSFQIIAGQYLGIGTLVVISFIGSFIGSFFDARYVGFLGLFPIYLAVRHVIGLIRHNESDDDDQVKIENTGMVAIAGVTVANGADNIGVYVPLLTTMSAIEKTELIITFAIMTYLWCMAAKYLAGHPVIAKQLDKFGHIIMPVVLFALGVFIMVESGTWSVFG